MEELSGDAGFASTPSADRPNAYRISVLREQAVRHRQPCALANRGVLAIAPKNRHPFLFISEVPYSTFRKHEQVSISIYNNSGLEQT